MKNHKTRILGIAPYESMKTAMQNLAKNRTDVEIDVYVGDLNEGTKIVRQNLHNNYDVIISRGGTAEMIGKTIHIPVVEISLSVYDILRAIKLAENYSDRYAIVGFPAITRSAHLLCDLLKYKLDIVTIHDGNEVFSTLESLKENGYRMLLCDMVANTTAKKLGLNSILITSGVESIESAFDQAVKLSASYTYIQEKNHLLEEVIRGDDCDIIVFNQEGDLFFSSWEPVSSEQHMDLLRREIPDTLSTQSHKTFKNINGTQYSCTGIAIPYANQTYTVFYLTPIKIPLVSNKCGISYLNKKDAEEHFFNSFYNVTGAMCEIQESIKQFSQCTSPIVIIGENGTGKTQIAHALYVQSPLQSNPLITIDCSLVNDKNWKFLTNHYNSPLNDNNNTIYFKNVDELPENQYRQLLSILLDMNLCKRNRILFACVNKDGINISNACLKLINTLSCLSILLPPLRERAADIPTLSSLYLGTLNVELAKQIIGFEPEAMLLIQQYNWPYNHTQFKRVLRELALLTTTPYISTQDVQTLLKKEQASLPNQPIADSIGLNLNRSLDEINYDIINQVLLETGGNQTIAAKRLEISRTTLWRYIKRT